LRRRFQRTRAAAQETSKADGDQFMPNSDSPISRRTALKAAAALATVATAAAASRAAATDNPDLGRASMADFSPKTDVQAISHLNVVVEDIEVATEFYGTVLGFERAVNADGPMDYPGVTLASFARDAGFADGKVDLDIRFLKHPTIALYLELFTYRDPPGDSTVHRRATNDMGGIRHVAVEVPDAVAAHAFIRAQQDAYAKKGLRIDILGGDHIPEELTPFPYKFFYWIDPWGVQWEMEQGRPIDRAVQGIVG
jgi:catechol 2,3-dioxygenase-like lactoylglutathione lyase family enzyme